MKVQLQQVISDITGVTGKAILEAILKGEREAAKLAQLRQPEIKADQETIRKSLEGDWRPEHLFTLRQSWEMYGQYVAAIEDRDRQITKFLEELVSCPGDSVSADATSGIGVGPAERLG